MQAERTDVRAAPDHRRVALAGGVLELWVDRADWPLDRLCAFAARENPKRGYLVVSKVLGRHWPARPSAMRASVAALAARLPPGLAGPVLVVGLAETAVCLGQTLHGELRRQTGRHDIWFIHSTRQRVAGRALLARFDEPHSHAAAHLIYRPEDPSFPAPRSLVLVDDEVSTGTTLANLARALVDIWPGVERVAVAALTDWSDGRWHAQIGRPVDAASLLQGRLAWTPDAAPVQTPAFTQAAQALGQVGAHNLGRFGLRNPIDPSPADLPPCSRPLRLVGTGEFTFPAFRLAERLEAAGHDVVVQATSRSPVRVGGAIGTALRFADNYGTGVPNFLYNADPADGRETWIAHETGAASVDPALIAGLDARLVGWP